MKLSVGRVLSAALLLLSSGCKMCCPAYDYCSPTNPHGDQSMCCDHGRRGSYFNGDSGYYGEQVVGEETIVQEGATPGAPQNAPAAPMEQNLQEVAPPPPVQPAPPPRGPMTSRSRTTVMSSSSQRTR